MRLTELEPEFIAYRDDCVLTGKTFAEAQGIWFLCPLCFQKLGGSVGCHSVDVSFDGCGVLPQQGTHNKEGKPVRWQVSGTGIHDLTTKPSIQLEGGCNWHGWITNGEVT